MKFIIVLLFPLFCFSQESILAMKISGLWEMNVNIVGVANIVNPAQSSFSYDTSFIDTTLGVIVLGDWSGSVKKTDRVLYQIQGDTMYTQLDIYTQVFLITCESSSCCLSCKKNYHGTCSCENDTCEGKGKCDERTYGIADIPSTGISNAVRAYLQ